MTSKILFSQIFLPSLDTCAGMADRRPALGDLSDVVLILIGLIDAGRAAPDPIDGTVTFTGMAIGGAADMAILLSVMATEVAIALP